MPRRSYTQPTHARPDAACTARRIRTVRSREYQNALNVVVTIASGIPGKAHKGEIDGARRLTTNGAATAPRSVHTNTAATQTSYRRTAGGNGAAGPPGLDGSEGLEGLEISEAVEVTGNGTAQRGGRTGRHVSLPECRRRSAMDDVPETQSPWTPSPWARMVLASTYSAPAPQSRLFSCQRKGESPPPTLAPIREGASDKTRSGNHRPRPNAEPDPRESSLCSLCSPCSLW